MAAFSLALFALAAQSEQLARLHVRAFSLALDTTRATIGGAPFHATLNVVLDDAIRGLDNVTLPDLSGFTSLGDERRCATQTARGRARTTCSETLTLAPTIAGRRTIGPAHFDAVDASTNRAERFSTNSVTIDVAPASASAVRWGWPAAVLASVALVTAIALRKRKRRVRSTISEQIVASDSPARARPLSAAPMVDDETRWRMMIEQLRISPTRARVQTIRELLRERLGARRDETFADLCSRYAPTCDEALLGSLRGIERAAFIDDEHLPATVHETIPALLALGISSYFRLPR